MAKSPEMQKAINEISKALFGRRPFEGQCVTCGSARIDPSMDFRNGLSVKEFYISGMCQECQDSVFKEID